MRLTNKTKNTKNAMIGRQKETDRQVGSQQDFCYLDSLVTAVMKEVKIRMGNANAL